MTDFEAMSVYDAGEDDILNTMDKFNREYPSMTITKGSMNYLTYQSGSSNKYHIFFVAQDKSGNYFAFNGAARIGYSPKLHRIAGPTTQEMATGAARKKMRAKQRKGYVDRTREFAKFMAAEHTVFLAEYVVTESGLPVIPDSYGTNSALDSGQGVPVWYGSAEGDTKANSARKLVEMVGSEKIEVNSIDNLLIESLSGASTILIKSKAPKVAYCFSILIPPFSISLSTSFILLGFSLIVFLPSVVKVDNNIYLGIQKHPLLT